MGLLSSIKKGVKNIWKGVKKTFKKVGKFAGKVLNSKWGKRLMFAAAIFTGGMALMAGAGSFMGTTGTMFSKFVAGGKGFLAGLSSPIATAKGAVAGAQAGGGVGAALQGAAQGSGALASPMAQATADLGGAAAGAPAQGAVNPPLGSPEQIANATARPPLQAAQNPTTLTAPPPPPPPPSGGLLGAAKKVGGKAFELAKTTGGGLIISNAVQGYAAGKAQEDMLKKGGFADRRWDDPEKRQVLYDASDRSTGLLNDYSRRRAKVDTTPERSYTGYARDPRRGRG